MFVWILVRFCYQQFLYMKYIPRLKKFLSSKLNFKNIYILMQDSFILSSVLVKTIFSWSLRNVSQDNFLEFVLPAVAWRF